MFTAVGHWRTKSETVKQERRQRRLSVCLSTSRPASESPHLEKQHNTASRLQAPGEEQPEKHKNRGDGGRRFVVGPRET